MATTKTTMSLTLLTMPGEIRNRIYRFAVIDSETILLKTEGDTGINWRYRACLADAKCKGKKKNSFFNFPPKVLVVSQQLRSEVSPIFYEENRFTLWPSALTPAAVKVFERLCGRSAVRMTRVSISMSGEYFPPMTMQVAADGSSIKIKRDELRVGVNSTVFAFLFNDTCDCLFQKLADNYNKALANGMTSYSLLFSFLKEVEFLIWRFSGPRPILQVKCGRCGGERQGFVQNIKNQGQGEQYGLVKFDELLEIV